MKILVSAIEYSANIHLKEVLNRLENVEICGIFDKSLGKPLVDLQSLAIMGIGDIITKIPFFLSLSNKMVNLAKDCDKVLLIDGSGFNLPLAKKLKKNYPNKEIIYYILPQAWAWRRYRIKSIEKYCDKLASILPFEENFYTQKDKIEYVGHPLLDLIPSPKEKPSKDIKNILWLPGSRRSEIASLMPIFHQTRRLLHKEIGDFNSLIVIPPYFNETTIKNLYGDLDNFEIVKDTYDALDRSDFAFVCSGTATLEASLKGTPMLLVYIAKKFDYFIAKRLIDLEYVGLANLFFKDFCNRAMHIELLQEDVNPYRLVQSFRQTDRFKFYEDAKKLREYLKSGSAKRVAEIING